MIKSAIQTYEIDVVVQGPISPLGSTFEVIQSIRRALPGSNIILSTWKPKKEDYDFKHSLKLLDPDQVILSLPPKAPIFDPHVGTRSNLNRMLLSTNAGLSKVSKPFVLKLRTDTPILETGFLGTWSDLFSKREQDFTVFSRKLIIPSLFTRPVFSPSVISEKQPRWPAALHVSDWAAFGPTQDVKALYSVPQVDDDYATFMTRIWPSLPNEVPFKNQANFQLPPEMWIGINAVGTKLGINPEHFLNIDNKTAELANRALISNFIVLSTKTFGISSFKYWDLVNSPWLSRISATTLIMTRDYAKAYDEIFGTSTRNQVKEKDHLLRIRRNMTPLIDLIPRRIRTSLYSFLLKRTPAMTLDELWHQEKAT